MALQAAASESKTAKLCDLESQPHNPCGVWRTQEYSLLVGIPFKRSPHDCTESDEPRTELLLEADKQVQHTCPLRCCLDWDVRTCSSNCALISFASKLITTPGTVFSAIS